LLHIAGIDIVATGLRQQYTMRACFRHVQQARTQAFMALTIPFPPLGGRGLATIPFPPLGGRGLGKYREHFTLLSMKCPGPKELQRLVYNSP
jgi:hypothetical protein